MHASFLGHIPVLNWPFLYDIDLNGRRGWCNFRCLTSKWLWDTVVLEILSYYFITNHLQYAQSECTVVHCICSPTLYTANETHAQGQQQRPNERHFAQPSDNVVLWRNHIWCDVSTRDLVSRTRVWLRLKPGKKKGPPGNLRPIILLSVLRNLLTICLMRRTWDRLKTRIPLDQAAYQEGRSTTEQVFFHETTCRESYHI